MGYPNTESKINCLVHPMEEVSRVLHHDRYEGVPTQNSAWQVQLKQERWTDEAKNWMCILDVN